MNFLIFLLFYLICTSVLICGLVFAYRFYFKRKVREISSLNEKTLEKFFDEM